MMDDRFGSPAFEAAKMAQQLASALCSHPGNIFQHRALPGLVPAGAVTVFSAHGVAEAVASAADDRTLHVIDATCPLVSKVHKEGQRYAARGYEVVLMGHAGHPEAFAAHLFRHDMPLPGEVGQGGQGVLPPRAAPEDADP